MKVSTKGRYGLRVMVELALRAGGGPVLAEELARAQDLSPKYLHVLLGSLRAAGLVRASRGSRGGYELAGDPAKISALEVVEALEGRIELAGCGGGCARTGSCAAQELWEQACAALRGSLGGRSLAELAGREGALRRNGGEGWVI